MAKPGYMDCTNRLFDALGYLKWTELAIEVEFSAGYTGRRFTEEGEDSEDGSLGGSGVLLLTRAETPFDSTKKPTRADQGMTGGTFLTYRRRCGCPGIILAIGEEGDPEPIGTVGISITYHPPPDSEDPSTTSTSTSPVQIDFALSPDDDELCPQGLVKIQTLTGAVVDGGTDLMSGAESADLVTGGPYGLTFGASDIFEQTITRGITDPVGGIDTIGSESTTLRITATV